MTVLTYGAQTIPHLIRGGHFKLVPLPLYHDAIIFLSDLLK
jgi:hypothetical protein